MSKRRPKNRAPGKPKKKSRPGYNFKAGGTKSARNARKKYGGS